jgi:hypothetical protein
MPNLYGVANAPCLLTLTIPLNAADVTVATASITAIGSSPALIAPSNGYFYCKVDCGITIVHGASVATGLNMFLQIGAGSYGGGVGWNMFGMAANGAYQLVYSNFTIASQVAWQGGGSTVTVGLQAATQTVTAKSFGWAVFSLLRAPDQ